MLILFQGTDKDTSTGKQKEKAIETQNQLGKKKEENKTSRGGYWAEMLSLCFHF